ncbi:MAG TPA: hypothetical protein VFT48_15115 [Pyrinomonadaceae bacterium]|nr:hypothetical protein [Pyrinomonadaceae bacterium]
MSFPVMLAGPILRRVEPTLVTVWVALRESAGLELKLWNGLVSDTSSSPLFSGPANQEVPGAISKTSRTIRIGDKLHIGVVTFKLPPDKNTLLPHLTYSYNVTLTTASGTHDLKSLGLLKTGNIEGKPNLAMGYANGFLPSFALPPAELTDLRILHGSCRRINKNVPDGLAWVDDFIETDHANAKIRPHQLLLSGDQIYADDVDAPFLQIIMKVAHKLIGTQSDTSEETIPLEQLPALNREFPADEIHFPPGYRFSLSVNEAKLSSKDGASHLFSLGEFCAMYLLVWSNACWPDQLPTEDSLKSELLTFDWLGRMPGDLRTHIIGESEKARLFNFVQLGELTSTVLQQLLPNETIPKPLDETKAKEKKKKKQLLDDRTESASKEVLLFKQLWLALPKVRRALANVPTYMIFDDHEVTDDWYLNPMWRDRVLTNRLGKTTVRNGLISYALFQGWGNDPIKFESGDNKSLLDEAAQLFPANTVGPDEAVGNRIDFLLGLDLGDEDDTPPVKWHFSVKGSRHLLIAIDNRTRRSFVSRIGPPGNLSPRALAEQIPPGPLEAGLEVLVLIAPLPVIGPPMLDELVAPLVYRIFDLTARNNLEKQAGTKGMAGTDPDAIEAWAFDPFATENLLKRLETYRRVVILSGDVHNGSSQSMSYWKKGDTEPAVFAQFTSSGMKNTMPWYIRFIDRSFATAQKIIRAEIGTERLGWNVRNPTPLTFPANVEIASSLLSRLRHEPILIPGEGWPRNTTINRPPDFQWRAKALRDQRPDDQRPDPTKIDPLNETNTDITPNLDAYRKVLVRHAKQLTQVLNSRQILFANNVGRVRFELQGETPVAVQELYTAFPSVGAETLEKPALFTLHKVPLSSPSEKKPEDDFAKE